MKETLQRFIGGHVEGVRKLNKMVERIHSITPIAGAGIALTETAEGTQINVISTRQAGVLGGGSGGGGIDDESGEGGGDETFYDEIFGHVVKPITGVKYVVNFATRKDMILESFGGKMIELGGIFLLKANNTTIGTISAKSTESTWVSLDEYELDDGSEIAIVAGTVAEDASGFSFNIRCRYQI